MKKRSIIWKSVAAVISATPLFGMINLVTAFLYGILPYLLTVMSAKLLDGVNDFLTGKSAAGPVLQCGVIYLILFLVRFSLDTVQSVVENYGIYEKTMHVLRIRLGQKYAGLPLLDFENSEIHNLAQRARECVYMDILPRIYLRTLKSCSSMISVISITLGLAVYSKALLPLSILGVLPYLITRMIRGKEFYCLKTHQAPQKRKTEYLWHLFSEAAAQREMRIMGTGQYLTEKWQKMQLEANRDIWEFSRRDSESLFFCDFIKSVGFMACFAVCLLLLLNGELSVGVFGACILAVNHVQTSTGKLMIDLGEIPQYAGFAEDYFRFLELPEEVNGTIRKEAFSRIDVDLVSFSYPNAKEKAVDNISFTLKAGEKVVIVGENGSGKTTLGKLLLGQYFADDGSILYDGVNVKDIDKKELYKCVSVVPQDFMRCNLSLRENIAISDTAQIDNDKKIWETLSQAGLDEVCCGLDDQIGREFAGNAFSGGEWQRIAIARACFKNSSFVLLDEPTSALDPLAETEILKNFIHLSQNRTAVIVSHRVGLCRFADKILVMEKGRLAECGDFESLISKKGVFYKMFESQAFWYRYGSDDRWKQKL